MNTEEILKELGKLPTPVLSDSMGRFNSMVGIKPIVKGFRLAGVALTVKAYPGDELAVKLAIDKYARKGSVVVIDAGGFDKAAIGGDLMARRCIAKETKGWVIDGYTRDLDEIEALGFPVFAKGVTPNSAISKFEGNINVPITCGEVLVRPEDFVVGDNNGVVVVPQEQVANVLTNAMVIKKIEDRFADALDKQNEEQITALSQELGKIKEKFRSTLF